VLTSAITAAEGLEVMVTVEAAVSVAAGLVDAAGLEELLAASLALILPDGDAETPSDCDGVA
jgi:hypothetical protein